MTESLNGDTAEALANLVHALRPEWGVPGIKTALYNAKDRGTAWEITHAALYAAEDLAARTPAIIHHPGAHWTRGRELGSSNPRGEKCDQVGHEGKPAHNCPYCIADSKAIPDDAATTYQSAPDPEKADMYARGARRAKAAWEAARTTDARKRAAGDDDGNE